MWRKKIYQWPHIEGNGMHLPTPGTMCWTSYSESSGGKYRSVWEGRTRVLALMLLIASSKSNPKSGYQNVQFSVVLSTKQAYSLPLYGLWSEQSPTCHMCSITSRFSGSVDLSVNHPTGHSSNQPKPSRAVSELAWLHEYAPNMRPNSTKSQLALQVLPLESAQPSQKRLKKSSSPVNPKAVSYSFSR